MKSLNLSKLLAMLCLTMTVPMMLQAQQYRTGGAATFYGGVAGSAGGNCGIPVNRGDKMHCAINTVDYKNSEACGAYVEVVGPNGKKVVLQVVDRCPECPSKKVQVTVNGKKQMRPVHLDLTQEAFAKIGKISEGGIPIKWRFVPNPKANRKIRLQLVELQSYYVQVRLLDIKFAVKKLEYFHSKKKKWFNMTRQYHNVFLEDKNVPIPFPLKLRATSVRNQKVVFNNVWVSQSGKIINSGKQFGGNAASRVSFGEAEVTLTEGNVVYPNPVQEVVNLNPKVLKLNKVTTVELNQMIEKPTKWVLFNRLGKQVMEGQEHSFSVSHLSPGIYFIQIEGQAQRYKVIKK